eukprot:9472884-Pyramimonas_sp.AAC.2
MTAKTPVMTPRTPRTTQTPGHRRFPSQISSCGDEEDAYSLQTDRSTDSLVSFVDRVLRDGDLDGDLASIEEKEQIRHLRGEMHKLQDQLREKKSELVTVVSPMKKSKKSIDESKKSKDERSEAGSRKLKRRPKNTPVASTDGAATAESPPVKEQTTTATSMDTPRSKSWYQMTEKLNTRQPKMPTNPTGLELFLIGICI